MGELFQNDFQGAETESVGAFLKRQRNMRHIGLEEVAQQTKISMRSLQALEADNFAALPGHVFAKGFVKQYAKAIGINADEAMYHCEDYLKTVLNIDPEKKERPRWLQRTRFRLKTWVWAVLGVIAALVVGYFLSRV